MVPSTPSSYRSHLLKPQPPAIQNGNLFEDKAFSLVAQMVKNCRQMQCRRPGFHPYVRKDPLGKQMATHSSILAWRIPWTEEPGGLQSMG